MFVNDGTQLRQGMPSVQTSKLDTRSQPMARRMIVSTTVNTVKLIKLLMIS